MVGRIWLVALAATLVVACGARGNTAAQSSADTAVRSAGAGTQPARQAAAGTDWPTYHGSGTRAGAVSSGPSPGRVRLLWSEPVSGAVYAEPLVVGGKVIVATQENEVDAFDAATGRRLWRTALGTPVDGGSLPCGNINPSGITSTPVADPASGTLYVVAFVAGPHHELAALDLNTGALRFSRPIDAPGADPQVHQQRAALALSRGRVYVAYGGLYGDCGDYRGRVVSAPAGGAGGALRTFTVPARREGGIWAPSGPAFDASGTLYVTTGNGSSTTSFDFGNSVIRLTPALRRTAYFAPPDATALSGPDLDLGSTGPVLLPGSRAFVIGKSGVGYLLDTRRLGGRGRGRASRKLCDAAFGGSAAAGSTIYVPCTSGIVAVRAGRSGLRTLWRQSAATLPPIRAGSTIWAMGGSTLYGLSAATGRVAFSAEVGQPANMAAPAAAGGRIFVAAGATVRAFG